MSLIKSVIEYPENGFAILHDSVGRFLAFRDHDSIVPLDDEEPISFKASPRDYLQNTPSPEEEFDYDVV